MRVARLTRIIGKHKKLGINSISHKVTCSAKKKRKKQSTKTRNLVYLTLRHLTRMCKCCMLITSGVNRP